MATISTIVYSGDSLTSGYYASIDNNKFATRAAKRVGASEVYAGATGTPGFGTMVSNVLAFYGGSLPAGDVTVIELGTNDFTSISVGTFQTQYGQLLAKVNSPKVVCLGPWRASAATAFDSTTPPAWDA